jgi:hypothetical protein
MLTIVFLIALSSAGAALYLQAETIGDALHRMKIRDWLAEGAMAVCGVCIMFTAGYALFRLWGAP